MVLLDVDRLHVPTAKVTLVPKDHVVIDHLGF